MSEVPDFSHSFNTPIGGDLSKETGDYFKWIGRQQVITGRDLEKDRFNYDVQGFYKSTGGADLEKGKHMTDEFKKPNHPTFSDESIYHEPNGRDVSAEDSSTGEAFHYKAQGGHWDKNDEGKDTFTPGSANLKMYDTQGLIDYFKDNEPDSQLILPGS